MISIDAPDAEDRSANSSTEIPTFCLDAKALPAAEQFLLSRYALHQQVYFHKVKCCIEHMFTELLTHIAGHAGSRQAPAQTGLPQSHPLLRFFKSENLEDYLALDDTVLWGALDAMSRAGDSAIAELATRLRDRTLFKTLDMASIGVDPGKQIGWARKIDRRFTDEIRARTVLKDEDAKLSIYTEVGGDEERMHKKLHVLDGGKPVEISTYSKLVAAIAQRTFTRYYFSAESDRNAAERLRQGRA